MQHPTPSPIAQLLSRSSASGLLLALSMPRFSIFLLLFFFTVWIPRKLRILGLFSKKFLLDYKFIFPLKQLSQRWDSDTLCWSFGEQLNIAGRKLRWRELQWRFWKLLKQRKAKWVKLLLGLTLSGEPLSQKVWFYSFSWFGDLVHHNNVAYILCHKHKAGFSSIHYTC